MDRARSQSQTLLLYKLRIRFNKMSDDESQHETTLTKASVGCPENNFVCPADNCGKKLKTKQTLSKHVDKFHKVSQLDYPARLALFRIREDGDNSSTQGNSRGEVNSPKVVSLSIYACSTCDKDYVKKEEVIKHIADAHSPDEMSGDEEGLNEA